MNTVFTVIQHMENEKSRGLPGSIATHTKYNTQHLVLGDTSVAVW